MKLKELEAALKEVVREADDAGQTFNNELLSRKRDLERVLADSQAIEGRIAKSSSQASEAVREAELLKRDLESVIEKSFAVMQAQEAVIEKATQRETLREYSERVATQEPPQTPKYYTEQVRPQLKASADATFNHQDEYLRQRVHTPQIPQSVPRVSKGKEIIPAAPSPDFEYDKMLEPPSFSQLSDVTERRVMENSPKRSALREQIERSVSESRLPDHLEEALASVEQIPQLSLREDPRLGVLGGPKRSSQVV